MSSDLDQLVRQLRDPDVEQRREAAELLAQRGEAIGAHATAMLAALSDEDEATREWVTSALEDAGPPAPGDAAALQQMVARDELDSAYWAATLLGRLGADADVAWETLQHSAARSAHAGVRKRAAWALDQIRRSG